MRWQRWQQKAARAARVSTKLQFIVRPRYVVLLQLVTQSLQDAIGQSRRSRQIHQDWPSPLLLSSQNGHAGLCKVLLDSRADVNKAAENDGATPLCASATAGHTEVCKILLDSRAEVDKCLNGGASPLLISSKRGFTTICKMLLDSRANTAPSLWCRSPLDMAIQGGHAEV